MKKKRKQESQRKGSKAWVKNLEVCGWELGVAVGSLVCDQGVEVGRSSLGCLQEEGW